MNKGTAYLIYKLLIAGVVVAALCVGGWILYKEVFSSDRGLQIDDTENVVDKITKIGQFTSVTYYEEQVLKNDKSSSFALSKVGQYLNSDSKDELILIAKGHVRAGFDLQKLSAKDITIAKDTISMNLPEPEIFDIILNPSDFEVYVETGDWSHQEIQEIQHAAKVQLHENALEEGVLAKAKSSGLKKLEALFKTFGFNIVLLQVSEN